MSFLQLMPEVRRFRGRHWLIVFFPLWILGVMTVVGLGGSSIASAADSSVVFEDVIGKSASQFGGQDSGGADLSWFTRWTSQPLLTHRFDEVLGKEGLQVVSDRALRPVLRVFKPVTLGEKIGNQLRFSFDFRLTNIIGKTPSERLRFGIYNSLRNPVFQHGSKASDTHQGYFAAIPQNQFVPVKLYREDGGNAIIGGGADSKEIAATPKRFFIDDFGRHSAEIVITREKVGIGIEIGIDGVRMLKATDENPACTSFDEIMFLGGGGSEDRLDFILDNIKLETVSAPVAINDPLNFSSWRVDESGLVEGISKNAIYLTYSSQKRVGIVLRPPQPIPLPDHVKYLSCLFARMAGDFRLDFQVQDGNGAVHSIPVRTSRPTGGAVSWQKEKCLEWSLWDQAISRYLTSGASDELNARVLPEFCDATQKLTWPRPLSLIGLKVTPAAAAAWDAVDAGNQVAEGKGALWLTQLQIKDKTAFESSWSWIFPGRLRSGDDECPVLLPDDLTDHDGYVTYEVEVRMGYQGEVVWRQKGSALIDRRNPAMLYENRITLPRLAAGRYFINTKTWRLDGVIDAERLMLELIVVQQNERIALSSLPSNLSLESGRKNNVFSANTREATLTLQAASSVVPANRDGKFWRVKVIDYSGKQVLTQDIANLEGGRIQCPVQAGMEYFAAASLVDAAGSYQRVHLHFGVANGPENILKQTKRDSIPKRDVYLAGQVHVNGEFWYGSRVGTYPWINGVDTQNFDRWLQQAVRAGVSVIAVGDTWGNHEMLPGVYQWSELDREIDAARQYGLKVILAYSADGVAVSRCFPFPLWVNGELLRDQDGNAPFLNFRPTYWDPSIRNGWQAYYKKLAEHVAGNPTVVGYRIENYALTGKPTSSETGPFRVDYSISAQKAFDKWCKEKKVKSAPLSRLFYLPGVPEQQLPSPDISEGFQNFSEFNSYTTKTRLGEIFAAIRSQDLIRQVQVDQKPFPYAIEVAIPTLRDGGVLKNEDSPNFKAAALRSMAVQAGVPYVEELHNHMPTSRSIADTVNFWNSYLSTGIFWLMRWNPDMITKAPVASIKGGVNQHTEDVMLDYVKESIPHWQEWIKASCEVPKVLVFGSRAQGLLGSTRAGYEYGIGGMETFSALFSSHQVPCHFADEYTDWVDLQKFSVVFACGEIVTEHAMNRLEDYARKGGKVVLVGSVGRYCPEKSLERDLLKRRLTNLPNVKIIESPARVVEEGKYDSASPYSFKSSEIDRILTWAGVKRDVKVISTPPDRFECQKRMSVDEKTLYIAVMRQWKGGYRENIEREADLAAKYGLAGASVVVENLPQGEWTIDRFHRDSKRINKINVSNGKLSFPADPMLAGEVQLYRLKQTTGE